MPKTITRNEAMRTASEMGADSKGRPAFDIWSEKEIKVFERLEKESPDKAREYQRLRRLAGDAGGKGPEAEEFGKLQRSLFPGKKPMSPAPRALRRIIGGLGKRVVVPGLGAVGVIADVMSPAEAQAPTGEKQYTPTPWEDTPEPNPEFELPERDFSPEGIQKSRNAAAKKATEK